MSGISHKIGRNDLCPCQSGKKYKQCCAVTSAGEAAVNISHLLDNARYCAFQLGDWPAAEAHYRQVLLHTPNQIEALIGLGQVLLRRHWRTEGLGYLQKAASLVLKRPDKFELHVLVEQAEQLRNWGDVSSALPLYRAVVKRAPKHLPALHGMAGCLHRLHQTDLAMQTLNRLITIYPQDPAIQLQMALFEFDLRRYDDAQQRLQQLLEHTDEPRHLARAYLELARIHDKQKQYAQVFPLLNTAWYYQQQLAEWQQLDRQYLFAKIAQYQTGFDRALLSRFSTQELQDGTPIAVFLFGFLRSGTTLSEQALAAHPQILSSDENTLLTELSEELERITGIKNDTPAALRSLNIEQTQQLRRYYWQCVEQEYGKQALERVFINKVALNSIEVGLISCVFPESKIIFALRDPRDVCLSCAMQAFSPSPATANLVSWQGIAQQYAAIMGSWLQVRTLIQPPYYELRYEDVVLDFQDTITQTLNFLGLEWHEQISRYYQKSQGRYIATPSFADVSKPIYQDALARWQPYQQEFESIQSLLSPYIKAFGYH